MTTATQCESPIPGPKRLVGLHAAELPRRTSCAVPSGTCPSGLPGSPSAAPRSTGTRTASRSGILSAASRSRSRKATGCRDFVPRPTIEDPACRNLRSASCTRWRAVDSATISSIAARGRGGGRRPARRDRGLSASTLIANIATRQLSGSGPDRRRRLDLANGDNGVGEEQDWDLDHFVGLLGRIDAPGTWSSSATPPRARLAGSNLQPVERVRRRRSIGPEPAGRRGRSSSPPRVWPRS